MLKSFVTFRDRQFLVKTAKVTPTGFVKIRTTDKYSTLEQADKRSDDLNYLWGKLEDYRIKHREMAGIR
jgi:hypothetical protein